MRNLVVSILLHVGILFLPQLNKSKEVVSLSPQVESSEEVIHISFKLDESGVRELKKKIETIKKAKKVAVKKVVVKTQEKLVSSVAAPKVVKVVGKKHLEKYLLELVKFIEKKKHYPKMALRMRQAGSVEISLAIDREGNFHHVHIKNASPYSSLNKAALSLVEEISKFKPLPAEMGKKITLNIPLKYALDN